MLWAPGEILCALCCTLIKKTQTCSTRCLLYIKLTGTTQPEDHPINALEITLPLEISVLILGHVPYIGTQFLPHIQRIPFPIKRPVRQCCLSKQLPFTVRIT